MSTWTSAQEYELTEENLRLLLDNKIAAIRIRGFATPKECARFAAAAKKGNIQYYNVSDRIGFIESSAKSANPQLSGQEFVAL